MLTVFQEVSEAARYAAVADVEVAAEAPTAARVAALRAGQAYRGVTQTAIQLFGGIGSSGEHGAHLYYRRAWAAERLSGARTRTGLPSPTDPPVSSPGDPPAARGSGIL